jgi:hypothetical protein
MDFEYILPEMFAREKEGAELTYTQNVICK